MDLADLSALLGEDVSSESYSDIWVVVGPGRDAALGEGAAPEEAALLGEARRLADGLGCYVHAVIADEAGGAAAIAYGADRVHVAADAAGYLAGQHPEFVLLPASLNDLGARIAQHFEAGLITNAAGGLEIEADTRALLGRRPVYEGEYLLELAVTSAVKVATLETAGLPAPYADPGREGETLVSDLPAPPERLADVGPADYAPPQWRPLTKAKVIVAIGRGLGEAEAVHLARRLAERLGGEVGGDRSARDAGWIDEEHEVGVTGQEVAPDVYLALGILGDTIHNAAITGARRVIAVHSNPQAPIFQSADLGFVAEPKEVLSALVAALD
jgi:electron transfer flavoprotein alpha subunit